MIVGKGAKQRTFAIHEDIAKQHSDFIAAALRNGFIEGATRTIRLPEEDPQHFEVFVNFVYTGRIYSFKEDDRRNEGCDDEWNRLGECWIVGDKLLAQNFQDAVVDSIGSKIVQGGSHPLSMHELIYPKTVGPNSMKSLLVEIGAFSWTSVQTKERKIKSDSAEFFLDLAVRLKEMTAEDRKGKKPWVDAGCRYHVHGNERPCYKTFF